MMGSLDMDFQQLTILVLCSFYQGVYPHLLIQQPDLELTYTVTEYGQCLMDEFRLHLYIGHHLDDCLTACALRPHCKALTYHSMGAASMCELFKTEGSERVLRKGCVYIKKRDIIIKKIPCPVECENGTTCNMESKSCVHTECTNLPNFPDGEILGNMRAVGSKIRFKCHAGITTHKEAVCQPDGEWSVSSVSCTKTEDCKELYSIGNRETGVYRIFPMGSHTKGILVRCDMTTPPGGWTIIQRRVDDNDFYKNWTEYKSGFGDVSGSYWLGNDCIWQLTSNKQYRLRIDLTTQDGMTGYAEYDHFSIEDEILQYALNVDGFHGNVGDSLTHHNRMKFTTKDVDNDMLLNDNCAVKYHGAWWYKNCHKSNLNGDYMNGAYGMGLNWFEWRGFQESVENTEMKIYPID